MKKETICLPEGFLFVFNLHEHFLSELSAYLF